MTGDIKKDIPKWIDFNQSFAFIPRKFKSSLITLSLRTVIPGNCSIETV